MSWGDGLPPGWATTSLSALVAAKVHQGEPAGDEFRYIDIGSVDRESKTIGKIETRPTATAPSRARQWVRAGDVLVSMTRPNLNAVAVVPDQLDGAIASTGFDVLRPVGAEPGWLFAHVRSTSFVREMSALVRGALYPAVNSEEVRSSEIAVPPLPEQKRIVAKIEALQARSDAAKEALDAIPPLLEKFRQSVLAAAFRGDLTKKWREAHPDVEPASKLLERIRAERRRRWEEANPKKKYVEPEPVDTEGLPELPEGWCWASVEEFTTRVADGVHQKPTYVASGIPFVTVKNLTAGPGISFDDLNYITSTDHAEYTRRTNPERGDVLISKDGTLGVVRHIDTDRVFSIFVSVALMKPVHRGTGRHLALVLETPQVQGLLVAKGSGLKHIHLSDLRTTPIPIPPIMEQSVLRRAVDEHMASLAAARTAAQAVTVNLASLNQSILAKAFRGELVPQDPNDEPAAVLLERIRQERAASRDATGPTGRQRRRRDQTEGAP